MLQIHKYPFIKYAVCTATGVIVYYYCNIYIWYVLAVFPILYLSAFVLHRYKKYHAYKNISRTIGLSLLFIGLGMVMAYNALRPYNKTLINTCTTATYSTITVLEAPIEKPNSYKLTVQLNECGTDSVTVAVNAKALLYIDKDDYDTSIHIGSRLLVKNTWQTIKGTGNPGAFDYHRYCLFNKIYFQSYISGNNYKVLTQERNLWFARFINTCRQHIIHSTQQLLKDSMHSGIANALLIGYRENLDKDIVQAYSNTGVIHVIAISGLHIGFLYMLLGLVLSVLFRHDRFRVLALCIQLVSIWAFVILTGASASVVRSGIMFSVIILGNIIQKKPNAINSISVAVFIQLFINPFSLWDVGFQLSYAAVLSIVLFYNPIYVWGITRYKAINYVWKMNAVTLSAQVLTLPIILYTFHQFPNYFLLTNLVIVPLSNVVLFGLLLLLAAHTFSTYIATKIAVGVDACIGIANTIVQFFDKLPYATTTIHISLVQAILLFIIALVLYYGILEQRGYTIKLVSIFVLLFTILHVVKNYQQKNANKLMVLNVPKQSFIGVLNKKVLYSYADSVLQMPNPTSNFYVKPTLMHLGSPNTMFKHSAALEIVEYKNYTVLIAHYTPKTITALLPTHKNYVYVNTHNSSIYKTIIPQLPLGSTVVVDQSNSYKTINYIKEMCKQQQLHFYNTHEQGAFVL